VNRISTARLLRIDLDSGATKPLYRQVYDAIRLAVLSGRLKPGEALPSTRALSRELGVARSTIVLAFDQLRAEGYLSGPPGAPTRVSTVVPDSLTHSTRADRGVLTARPRPISRRVAEVRQTPDLTGDGRPRAPRPFRAAVPTLDGFPMATWTACVNRELRRTPPRHLSYGDPRGLRELREAVSSYVRSARGVHCTPDQVLIVAGSQHALSLCLEVLVDPGGEVWVEDPGYFGTQGAVRASGAQLVPIPVTAEGIDVEYGRSRAPNARVAFVTPARQLPLGMTMSLNRRLALLSWAAGADSWIVETTTTASSGTRHVRWAPCRVSIASNACSSPAHSARYCFRPSASAISLFRSPCPMRSSRRATSTASVARISSRLRSPVS
jgi:GntR family transcriptional regulator/MocR family aminotransferase